MSSKFYTQLKNKNFTPVVLLFGDEDFLLEEAYLSLVNQELKAEGMQYNYDVFTPENSDIKKIVESANAFPMLSEKRLVVVKEFDSYFQSKAKQKNSDYLIFESYLKNPSPTTLLVCVGADSKISGLLNDIKPQADNSNLLKNVKFPYNILLNKYDCFEFPKVSEKEFASWVTKRFKEQNKSINSEAVNLLISHTPQSLRDLDNEVQKLSLYVNQKTSVEIDDIESLVGTNRENNVFELQKAIGLRDTNKSLSILNNMLKNTKQELLIISFLTKYFVSLWKLSELIKEESNQTKIAYAIGTNPYFLKDYVNALNIYKNEKITTIFDKLCETDTLLKSSSTNSMLLMQNLILFITKK